MSPETEQFWLRNPVDLGFRINSRFNDPREYRNNPTKKQAHEGIDLHAVNAQGKGVKVLAAQRGVVEKVGNFPPGYGNYVRIRHDWPDGETYITWYGHLERATIQEGAFVAAGAPIGIAGDTGFSFGIHLHLTLQHIGRGLKNYVVDDVVDPEPFFRSGAPVEVDECGFLADVTIPDGTTLQAGQPFPKTWRIRNNGTRLWGAGFDLAFVEGDPMGLPGGSVPLPNLKPGQEGEVTVNMTAPGLAGRYRSAWKPRRPDRGFFPFEMFAEIVVASARQDGLLFLEDLTIPDGTQVAPGEIFLKKWKVRNSGTTAWGSGFSLAFFSDSQMGAPAAMPVPHVKPGETDVLSVSLRAPAEPGTYQSTWRLRSPSGQFIGDPLFAMVNVALAAPTPASIDLMGYVDDVTFADGTQVRPGQRMEKVWRVRNLGTSTWGGGYALAFHGGDRMGGPESAPLPKAAPGQTVDIRLPLTAPTEPGMHRSVWKPRGPDGVSFDFEMFAEIEVVREVSPGDLVDDARYIRDLTIQPGSVRRAGESILKIWQVRNTGTSTWGDGYRLAFSAGEPIEGEPEPVPPAAPGAEVNVSVRLAMPLNPGEYEASWRLQSPDGELFGSELPLRISVPSPIPPANQRHGGALISYETFLPGARVHPGEEIQAVLRVRNTGNTTWGSGYSLVYEEEEKFGWEESRPMPACAPGKTARLVLGLKMPGAEGDYTGVWRMRSPDGKLFGARIRIELAVRDD